MLTIDYYSDVLCIWAWIAQVRNEELNKQLGSNIEWRHHYIDVFGDTEKKIQKQWHDRGHYDGFAEHVMSSAKDFEDITVTNNIWTKVRPTTSANAHLVLKAIELTHNAKRSANFALTLREAFFINAKDISNLDILLVLAAENDFDIGLIKKVIHNGAAIAELMSDYQAAKKLGIKGSPSYVLDGGRQTLYGNVGYRVLHANVEELLKHPGDEASWC
ncbi:MAG: DsbA family protein [Porticoccus sp.]